eukprot:1140028-Pelagomonas_calceolata.AAC.2
MSYRNKGVKNYSVWARQEICGATQSSTSKGPASNDRRGLHPTTQSSTNKRLHPKMVCKLNREGEPTNTACIPRSMQDSKVCRVHVLCRVYEQSAGSNSAGPQSVHKQSAGSQIVHEQSAGSTNSA